MAEAPLAFPGDGSTTTTQDNAAGIAPPPVLQKMMQARAIGASWDQIDTALAGKVQQARAIGATDQQIAQAMGVTDLAGFQQTLRTHIQRAASPNFNEGDWTREFRHLYAQGTADLTNQGWVPPQAEEVTEALAAAKLMGQGAEAGAALTEPFAGMVAGSFGPPGAVTGALLQGASKTMKAIALITKNAPNFTSFADGALALQKQAGAIQPTTAPEVAKNLAAHWAETGEHPGDAIARAEHNPGLRSELTAPGGTRTPPRGASVTPAKAPEQPPTTEPLVEHPESGTVTRSRYSESTGRLTVEFSSGHTYSYSNVPKETVTDFRRSESKGTFFNEQIRGKFETANEGARVLPDGRGLVIPREPGHVFSSPEEVTPEIVQAFRKIEGPSTSVSKAGAVGGVMPETAKQYGFNPNLLKDPLYNEHVTRTILADLSRRYNGDLDAVAVGYNAGPGRADKWLAAGKPTEEGALPEETRGYLSTLHRLLGSESGAFRLGLERKPTTPEMETFLKSVGESKEGNWLDALRAAPSKLYQEFFDADHPWNKLQSAYEEGKPLDDADNPKFLARLAETSDTTALTSMQHGLVNLSGDRVGESLKSILPEPASYPEFKGALIARMTKSNYARGLDTGGLDIGNADAALASLGGKMSERLERFLAFRNGTLEWLHKAGVIDTDTLEARSVSFTEDELKNPLATLARDTFGRAWLARKAIRDRARTDMAAEIGLAKKEPGKLVKFDLTPDDVKTIRRAVSKGETPQLYRKLGATYLRDDQALIFRDGKMETWTYADKDLATILNDLDEPNLSLWRSLMRKPVEFFRAGVVLNPSFPLRLLTYDVPWQFITKPGMRNTLWDTMRGLRGIFARGEVWDKWLASGGAEKVFGNLSQDKFVKDLLSGYEDGYVGRRIWNTLNTPLQALQAWGMGITAAQRLGRFTRGLEAGESNIRAAVASQEAAFHRAGFGGVVSRQFNQLHPFFTAHLNGLEQTARAMFGIGKTALGAPFGGTKNLLAFQAKAAALITTPLLLSWMEFRDQEWYKAAPNWQKDNGFFFSIPGTNIHPYIPFPPLLGFLYGGLPRRLAEGFLVDNPEAFKDLGWSVGAAALPPGFLWSSNLTLPVIENLANYSFFQGRPLVSDSQKEGLPPEQGSRWSSSIAQQISRFSSDLPLLHNKGLAPQYVDNLIRGWSGTLGEMAVRTWDLAAGAGPHGPDAPTAKFSDWPIVSSWAARNYPSASAQPIQDFYDHKQAMGEAQISLLKELGRGDMARVEELLTKNPGLAVMMRLNPDPSIKATLSARPPEDLERFQGLLTSHAHLTPEQQQAVQLVQQAQQAMKMEQFLVNRLYGAKTANDFTDPEFRYRGPLTADDRAQLLDRHFAEMQAISERANPFWRKIAR